VHDRG
jgi:hypothetical protein